MCHHSPRRMKPSSWCWLLEKELFKNFHFQDMSTRRKENSSGDTLTLIHVKAQLRGRKGSGLSNHKALYYAAAWWGRDRPAHVSACKTPNSPFHVRDSTHCVSYCSFCDVLEVHTHCWQEQSASQALPPDTTELRVLPTEKPRGLGLFQATQQRKQLRGQQHRGAQDTLNLTHPSLGSSKAPHTLPWCANSDTTALQEDFKDTDDKATSVLSCSQLSVRSPIQVGRLSRNGSIRSWL